MGRGTRALGLILAAGLLSRAFADDAGVLPRVAPAPGVLNLRTGDVGVETLPNLLTDASILVHPGARYVLVLDGPMTPERRAALDQAGVRLDGYLPTNSWISELSRSTPDRLRALGFISWAGEYRPEWKIDPALIAPLPQAPQSATMRALADAGERPIALWLFEHADAEAAMNFLLATPGVRVFTSEPIAGTVCIRAAARPEALPALAQLDDLQFVEQLVEYHERSNTITRGVVQSGTRTGVPFYDRGIHGEGQVVAVIDSGLAPQHCSFLDSTNPIGPLHRKLLAYNTSPLYSLHGTHVTCTAAGDAGLNDDLRGIAYAAKIVFNTHPDLTEQSHIARYSLHASQGARVHNNSWGADFTTAYDGGCRGIDSFQRDQEENLIVHAVSDGPVIKNPENAKNSLAVSAGNQSPDLNTMNVNGGRGPTDDGRRKPEITAPGQNIISAAGSTGCSSSILSGTSMSAPAVSGAIVLLRQYFTSGFYPSGIANPNDAIVPSGSLLKALAVNSARDMTNEPGFPSLREGWGRLQLDQTVYFSGGPRRLALRDVRNAAPQALSTGASHLFLIDVTNAAQPLKITLAYADVPAAVNAAFAPINNLDLVVMAPDGTTYFGNNFSGGASQPDGSRDALNNLEQALISNPTTGTWQVFVEGTAVNVAAQGYALVATGALVDRTCPADTNFDGGVTIDDLLAYLDWFQQGIVAADFNRDGGVTIDDLLAYLERFEVGC